MELEEAGFSAALPICGDVRAASALTLVDLPSHVDWNVSLARWVGAAGVRFSAPARSDGDFALAIVRGVIARMEMVLVRRLIGLGGLSIGSTRRGTEVTDLERSFSHGLFDRIGRIGRVGRAWCRLSDAEFALLEVGDQEAHGSEVNFGE